MMLRKGTYHQENQKFQGELQHYLFKADHFKPCTVTLRVRPCVSVAFAFGPLKEKY